MRTLIFAAIAVLFTGAAPAVPVQVSMQNTVEVESDLVRLGDFTAIDTNDAALKSYLEDLTVITAPKPDECTYLDREFVEIALARVGLKKQDITIQGPMQSEIHRPGRAVEISEILETITNHLILEENLEAEDFEVSPGRRMPSIKLSDVPYEIEVSRVTPRAVGPTRYNVKVVQEDSTEQKFPIDVFVTRYETLPSARRPIARGTLITEGDVEQARLDVSRMSSRELDRLVKSTEGILGKEARVDIPAGRPIADNMLDLPKVVESGDRVTLVAVSGQVRISAPGVAQQDGVENATIRVLNLSNQKRLYGRVVGPGLVQLQ